MENPSILRGSPCRQRRLTVNCDGMAKQPFGLRCSAEATLLPRTDSGLPENASIRAKNSGKMHARAPYERMAHDVFRKAWMPTCAQLRFQPPSTNQIARMEPSVGSSCPKMIVARSLASEFESRLLSRPVSQRQKVEGRSPMPFEKEHTERRDLHTTRAG